MWILGTLDQNATVFPMPSSQQPFLLAERIKKDRLFLSRNALFVLTVGCKMFFFSFLKGICSSVLKRVYYFLQMKATFQDLQFFRMFMGFGQTTFILVYWSCILGFILHSCKRFYKCQVVLLIHIEGFHMTSLINLKAGSCVFVWIWCVYYKGKVCSICTYYSITRISL